MPTATHHTGPKDECPRPRTINTDENAHKPNKARQRFCLIVSGKTEIFCLIVFVSVFIGFYRARNENAHKHNQARQRFCLIVSGKTDIFCLIVFVLFFFGFNAAPTWLGGVLGGVRS